VRYFWASGFKQSHKAEVSQSRVDEILRGFEIDISIRQEKWRLLCTATANRCFLEGGKGLAIKGRAREIAKYLATRQPGRGRRGPATQTRTLI